MTFSVYAIRQRGETEVRYVGQTRHDPAVRLRSLPAEHGWKQFPPSVFAEWLTTNRANLEVVTLRTFVTRNEAKAAERLIIGSLAALGHRLFNSDHMPSRLGIAA